MDGLMRGAFQGQFRGWILGAMVGGVLATGVWAVVPVDRLARRVWHGIERRLPWTEAAQEERTKEAYQTLFAAIPPRSTHQQDWGGVPSPQYPAWTVRRGYNVQLVAENLDYPASLAFAANSSSDPDAVLLYVTELDGVIKYITHSGEVGVYTQGLKNFDPVAMPLTDQAGLVGLTTIPGSEDLLVTGAYKDSASGLLKNRILRLVSEPGGKAMREAQVLLDLNEYTSPSHQIQQIVFGPDGKLYVSVGDGENPSNARHINRWGGKILRMNPDGTAPEDNPFYDPQGPDAPQSYVYAYGLRNIYDFDHDPITGRLYAAENGYRIDRLLIIEPGMDHGWDGDPDSTRLNALYTWGPQHGTAPTGVTFLRRPVLGPSTEGRLFVGTFNTQLVVPGPFTQAILELTLDSRTGRLVRQPERLIQHNGDTMANVVGLAEGPDGLYFTDYFGEVTDGRTRGHGRIWKVVVDPSTLSPALASGAPTLPPVEHGRVLFSQHCTACHRVNGQGGTTGPELSRVYANLSLTLQSAAYEATLTRLLTSQESFFVEQRDRLLDVQQAKGPQRVERWIRHHLEEPRFDNPLSQMPSFSWLKPEEREDLTAFLMTLK